MSRIEVGTIKCDGRTVGTIEVGPLDDLACGIATGERPFLPESPDQATSPPLAGHTAGRIAVRHSGAATADETAHVEPSDHTTGRAGTGDSGVSASH